MIDGIEKYLILTAIPYRTLPKLDVWRASGFWQLHTISPEYETVLFAPLFRINSYNNFYEDRSDGRVPLSQNKNLAQD